MYTFCQTFESVIPNDRTRISVKISNGSIKVLAPLYPGAIVSHIQNLEFSTDVVGDSRDSAFRILATSVALLAIDDARQENNYAESNRLRRGVSAWTVNDKDTLMNLRLSHILGRRLCSPR